VLSTSYVTRLPPARDPVSGTSLALE
jgi:hypothetical protein